jgi:ribose transport system permease protein
MRPPDITRIRWQTFISSGSSDDTRMIAAAAAARLSGINIDGVKLAAYALSGFCAAVGSVILTARVASGQPALGASLPLESVAAVVLGGVSLFGGRGSVIGIAFGVMFVSILSNGLNMLSVSSYTQMMVIGAALILAVALDQALMGARSK